MEIGKNDPCPCNSGRKFKKCHMKSSEPKESFQVGVSDGNKGGYFFTSADGKNWKKQEGTVAFRAYYHEKTYPEVDEIIQDFDSSIPEPRYILKERIMRLKHKLYGLKYHFDNFVDCEATKIGELNKDCKGTDHNAIVMDPKLIYELESFLFQFKSFLDVLAQTISITFRLPSITTYGDDGEKVINSLKQNSPKELKVKGSELTHILEANKKWISDTIDMRDEVTHFSDLEGFCCFIKHTWKGEPTINISYPSMPDGERASSYMSEVWVKTLTFLKNVKPYILSSL